jgi:hypothetical protein
MAGKEVTCGDERDSDVRRCCVDRERKPAVIAAGQKNLKKPREITS